MNAHRAIAILATLTGLSPLSYACGPDEYEQCWRVEIPLIGEGKDCKCLKKIGGTVGQIGEALKPTIGAVAEEVRKSPQAVANCIGNVGTCVRDVVASPAAALIMAYMDGLDKRSIGKSGPMSAELIALAQPYYSVDLRGITSAQGIDTGHGQTVAYCDRIFYAPESINVWGKQEDLHLVLHELEHTVQCQRRGKQTYLAEYILKGGLDIIKSGQFDVHDMHDYEVAAEAKADQVTPIIWRQIQQHMATGGASGSSAAGSSTAAGSGNSLNQQQWLSYCQTQWGVCAIPPVIGYRGMHVHAAPKLNATLGSHTDRTRQYNFYCRV